MAKAPIALQLYTVRDELARDFQGTVRRVAEIGYAGVELAGTGGLTADEMSALLQETGLKVAGSHVGLDVLQKDTEAIAEYYGAIGARHVGVPALPRDLHNPQGFRQAAQAMNRVGAALKAAGITLYYHNHAFEFDTVDGERGIDILYGETDPELVTLEADVYWFAYADQDPAALIRQYAGRFELVHLKDMTGSGDERTFAEVGQGHIDFEPIFAASEAQGVQWYIVEQDRCAGPSMESARTSYENLVRWGKG
jgi:sugar phosphate isomerase/epimerase